MTAHDATPTPGPWKIAHQARNQSSISIQDGAGTRICACRYNWRVPGAWDEALANARLIASAPALAEENARLRAILADMESAARGALPCINDGLVCNTLMLACHEARAALAPKEPEK